MEFKPALCVVLAVTFFCCGDAGNISGNDKTPAADFISIDGIGTVEGYAGYFSADLSPLGGPAYPSGYASCHHRWISDSPNVAYWMIFFTSKENELRDAVYIRATGQWETILTGRGGDIY